MNETLHTISREEFSQLSRLIENNEHVLHAAETFKALSDSTRLRMVLALQGAELCVHDLAQIIQTSESNTSHQLRLLRSMNIVKYRRAGKQVFYSIDDEHISRLVDDMMKHVAELR
jgi:DNA-binding transcriptional ArsR family regulator